jgi:hypothetical protein
VNRIRGAVLKGLSECRCETKIGAANVAGPWVTCFVDANITRPK